MLLALIAAQVCAGSVDGPLLVLAALVAPLVALLRRPPPAADRPNVVTACVAIVSIGFVLWANLLVFAEAAVLAGLARWHGAVVAGAVLLLATLSPGLDRRQALALPLGLAAVLLPLAAIGAAAGGTPWSAWSASASRPALRLAERSPWVTDGLRFERATPLTFAEGHRLTAVTPSVFRVTEEDGGRVVVREWTLGPGESLTVRTGDRVDVARGARVRFEAGKRVPGAPASGVVWADPPERAEARRLPRELGLLVTLLGGAMALVPRPGASATARVGAPLLGLVFVLAGASWGVYAATLAPELSAAGAAAATVLGVPAVAFGARAGATAALVAALGLLGLLVAAAFPLRDRVVEAAGEHALTLWTGVATLAAGLALWPADPWRVLAVGLGLAASAWAAPLLAVAGTTAGGPAAAGSTVGVLAFAGLAAVGPQLPAWAAPLALYPALLAAPLAFGATAVAEALRRPPAGWQEGATLTQ